MKIKLDENLPAELVKDLEDAGHDAQSVAEEGLIGAADSALLAHVRQEKRILMTMDKGIADIHLHPPEQTLGLCYSGQTARGERRFWRSCAAISPPSSKRILAAVSWSLQIGISG